MKALQCLRRTFCSATGNATRTHMHAHQLHTRSSSPHVLFFVFFHVGGVILSRSIVQRACFSRETSLYQCHHPAQLVASRGYLIQTAKPLKTAHGSPPDAFLTRRDSVRLSRVLNTIAFSRRVPCAKSRDVSFFETCSLQ